MLDIGLFSTSPSIDRSVPPREAAQDLQDLITASSGAGSCVYSCVSALQSFFCQEPCAVDFGLDVYRKATNRLPDSVEDEYGKGQVGAENVLKWYLVDFSKFFQGNVPPHKIGKEDSFKSAIPDASNIRFSGKEVSESREVVLEKLRASQQARLDIIILLAMQGRCHSMGFARLHIPDPRANYIGGAAIITINNMPDRKNASSPLWSKVDFIGCCTLLRSCGKSLIETTLAELRDQTLAKWNADFATFLHADDEGRNVDDDFVVKVHAAVSVNIQKKTSSTDSSYREYY